MMHLKAKCDLWIAIFYSYSVDSETALEVHKGEWHEDWSKPPIEAPIMQFQKGDTLTFKAIADGSDPYAQLATRYPEWFEIEELNK